jgi:hypothetical protein
MRRFRRLHVEYLESRTLLAGDLSAGIAADTGLGAAFFDGSSAFAGAAADISMGASAGGPVDRTNVDAPGAGEQLDPSAPGRNTPIDPSLDVDSTDDPLLNVPFDPSAIVPDAFGVFGAATTLSTTDPNLASVDAFFGLSADVTLDRLLADDTPLLDDDLLPSGSLRNQLFIDADAVAERALLMNTLDSRLGLRRPVELLRFDDDRLLDSALLLDLNSVPGGFEGGSSSGAQVSVGPQPQDSDAPSSGDEPRWFETGEELPPDDQAMTDVPSDAAIPGDVVAPAMVTEALVVDDASTGDH